MTKPTIVPVILSGGSGTRLWPASRAHQPKQLLPLVGDRSLIGGTLARVRHLPTVAAPMIVTNAAHAVGIRRAMDNEGLDDVTLIIEPVGRNTAPAVAVAARIIAETSPDALMLVLPSDHTIGDADAFGAAVDRGASLAHEGRLVTFGIRPTAPETGFGYIRAGEPLGDGAFVIDEFVEKPDLATARAYVESGAYSWNSGMFLFGISTFLAELAEHRPDIDAGAQAAAASSTRSPGRVSLDAEAFGRCPAESIDYAVMEQTTAGAVLPIDPDWSDIGSWTALWQISAKDDAGNATLGDVVTASTRNSLVHSHDRLVAVAGLDGVVVVDTADAVLVTTLDASQEVKGIVESLDRAGRSEITRSDWEPKPWGTITATSHVAGLHSWIVTVDPDSATDPSTDDGTVFIRLIDGAGVVVVEGERHIPPRGRAITIPSGHRWHVATTGENPLSIAVVLVDTVAEEPSAPRSYPGTEPSNEGGR